MADDKKSFVAYADWQGQFNLLSNEEAGILIKHILAYVNDENPKLPDDNRILNIAFEPIKSQLKRDLKKYEIKKTGKSNSGIIGNLKRWHLDLYELFIKNEISLEQAQKIASSRKESLCDNTDRTLSQDIAKIAVTVTDNDTVNVNDTVTVTVNDIYLGADAEKKSDNTLPEFESLNSKKEKEKSSAKKEKDFGKNDFRQVLLDRGAAPQHVEDWFKVRVSKKAQFTQTALTRFINECDNNNYPVALAVQACAEYSWQGFEYQWILNKQKYATGQNTTTASQSRQERIDSVERLGDLAREIVNNAVNNG
ncbi:DUF6291 domain-containing protein [Sphingobacterium sp. InxBP1]|uniref:DUF6291 domain-containing protein n=1 Tax=Sphingobacterium sp. InxBP1 TaxID=2870328 RepID=UPI0022443DE7|nr:DUF6291 domain-containing protein [Sphingobacterium sp. InxBP1]MCW8311450.1 DUF6291 domain-containing protein [Sphingobacterium sp. InxBP1]